MKPRRISHRLPSFNGATARKPWKTQHDRPGRPSNRSFNGATARKPWKTRRWTGNSPRQERASMGPRLGSRGRRDIFALIEESGGASMGPRLGSRGRQPRVREFRSFRRRASMGPRLGSRGRLWSIAEHNHLFPQASMGPRLGSRGRRIASQRWNRREASFNGATARKPWKTKAGGHAKAAKTGFNGATARKPWKTGWESAALPILGVASMGPRLGSRGRQELGVLGSHDRWSLQWGHGSEAVEDLGLLVDDSARWVASMGPRLGSRGRLLDVNTNTIIGDASMGPRLGSRGRLAAILFNKTAKAALQWGHGSEAVEDLKRRLMPAAQHMLQWGHGSEAVEDPRQASNSARLSCFNGATARKPWKTCRRQQAAAAHSRFNGATARKPWKTAGDRSSWGRGG